MTSFTREIIKYTTIENLTIKKQPIQNKTSMKTQNQKI